MEKRTQPYKNREELEDELIEMANFSTEMRTATKRDFQGNLAFAPENEVPMRMSNQLMILAQVLIFLNDGELSKAHHDILMKVALDSISRQRRVTLQVMAQYDRVDTKGLAQALNYPTKTALAWLEDINVLGGCTRSLVGNSDVWSLTKHGRDIMVKYDHIEYKGGDLWGSDTTDMIGGPVSSATDPGVIEEQNKLVNKRFDDIF